jgi:hypothetical protein
MYVTLVQRLLRRPSDATQESLDKLSGDYSDFAYIGSRRALRSVVLRQAEYLQQRLQSVGESFWQSAKHKQPTLFKRLIACRNGEDAKRVAEAWYGRRDWEKDSGIFPDFVLALDDATTFGNGAILELKDSAGSSIASFNSTIPTRFKSLAEMQAITGSRMVVEAAWLRDFPLSLTDGYLDKERHCFYLVRTHQGSPEQVRISLVEGSFFETLPKSELLRRVWEQILSEGGVPEEQKQQLLPLLAQLEQTFVARSRHIDGASVKPRFRIMAEVESEANVHTYLDIAPRTVNLVIKREREHDWQWLEDSFTADGVSVQVFPQGDRATLVVEGDLRLRCFSFWHRRNGEHWCLQWQLP